VPTVSIEQQEAPLDEEIAEEAEVVDTLAPQDEFDQDFELPKATVDNWRFDIGRLGRCVQE
jgi:hypothetical protein